MFCTLCGEDIKSSDKIKEVEITESRRTTKYHERCFNYVVHPPEIKCPRCLLVVKVTHEFGHNNGRVICDYIPYHRDPKYREPELGKPNNKPREFGEHHILADVSICPMSMRLVEVDKSGIARIKEELQETERSK